MVDTARNAQQDGHVDRIAILGAGAWGTALAHHLGAHGADVSLWARRAEFAAQLAATRANPLLPEVALADTVTVSAELDRVLAQADIIILAAPSHTVRELLSRAAPAWPRGAILVTAAKGIENDTLLTTGEVAEQVLGPELEGRVVVLS
ncbi:MAG TPA: 2-dehydropantoate 2-reductase N-terminal domain-containing protein, partial [Polyangiaceae bacterium]|nr:2-dehydropantoate 2-reductase N-terminal domain-containing protein [Polyangiaceae bacterium]